MGKRLIQTYPSYDMLSYNAKIKIQRALNISLIIYNFPVNINAHAKYAQAKHRFAGEKSLHRSQFLSFTISPEVQMQNG